MTRYYPQRVNNHQLEEMSERFFNQHLPRSWTSEKPTQDYGIDLRVDLYDEQNATGLELLVQLKASEVSNNKDYETVNLSITTYNHLWDKLQVVMLIKYVEAENKAYWLLLSDVDEPDQNQKTFTVRIPKTNDLETIDWKHIYSYVKDVTDEKLAARRRNRLRHN